MKKVFEEARLELIRMQKDVIVTSSTNADEGGEEGGGPDFG